MLFHFIIHRGWGYLEREKVSVKRERVELRRVATTLFLISPKISSIDSMEREGDRGFDSCHRLRNIFSKERFITRCYNVWISTLRSVKVEKF